MKVLVIVFLLSFVVSVPAADLGKERAAILETDQQWATAVAEGKDIERIVSFWSDDAKIFAPGVQLIQGKEAIRQFVQNSLAMPGFSIRWETTDVIVSNDGTLAYATGKNLTTMNDAQGEKITIHGKTVTVWRKEPSGAWKCIIDIWNDVPENVP